MPTSKPSAHPRASETGHQAGLSEHACQQLASATEVVAVCCRSWESLQQVQQHSAQRTALRLQQAAEQMRRMTHVAELMGIHSALMSSTFQEVSQLMQDLTLTTLRTHSALLDRQQEVSAAASSSSSSSRESARSESASMNSATTEAMQTASEMAQAATAAMLQSWTSMMGSAAGGSSGPQGRSSRHH